MKSYNYDISSLFSNLNSGNSFGTFNFGEYASIKNGSYGKLLKSYYAEQTSSTKTDKTDKTNKTDKNSSSKTQKGTDVDNNSKLKKESDSLKSAAEALNKDDLWKMTDGKYDMDKIVSAVKTFANEYNDTLAQADKVNSKDVSQDVKYMSGMTSTMSKALSKIGVSVGTDGKLTVNEDDLKKASVKNIKSLFSGATSYGSQIADMAGGISRDALMNSSIYGSNGALSSSVSSMFNKWV